MKKRIFASFLAVVILLSLLPTAVFAEGESEQGGESTVVCTQDDSCEAQEHEEGCPKYTPPVEDEGEPAAAPVGPTAEEQLDELIATLPAPRDIDPLDEEQLKEVYDQISAIYALAEENGLGNSDDGLRDKTADAAISAVIAALNPTQTLAEPTGITATGGSLTDGEYDLTGNVELETDLTIPAKAEVTIDLKGYTLTGTGTGSVITVNGKLTIKDSGTGGKITGGNSGDTLTKYGGGVRVDGGTLTLEGGTICGNTSKDGGGVYITNNGTFNMTGGEISGNTCVLTDGDIKDTTSNPYGSGAGVYVSSGTFTMSGGSIKDNIFGSMGGGVFVLKGASFEMTGGEISGNTAAQGGGVVLNGTFTMNGGSITGNTVTIPDSVQDVFSGTAIRGGGVLLTSANSTFHFNGGTISENKAVSAQNKADIQVTAVAGGVYAASNATVSISGAPMVLGNTTDNETVGNIWLGTGTVLTLSEDVTSSAQLPVTLESVSGRVTNRGSYTVASGVVTSENGDLTTSTRNGDVYFTKTVTEEKAACSAKVDGETVYYETLISALADLPTDDNKISILKSIDVASTVAIPTGTAILTSDIADGITITWKGGAGNCFSVPSGAELTIAGDITVQPETEESSTPPKAAFSVSGVLNVGEESAESSEYPKITGFDVSTSASNNGAAVNVANGGTLNLYSGSLTGNESNYGGAIYATGENARLNLYGGTVSGNTAVAGGGGVAVTNSAALTLAGTTISGNSAVNGGGVYVNSASVEMSAGTVGGTSATDGSNTASKGGGVYLDSTSSVFHMTGGAIQYNKAEVTSGAVNGGGVYVNNGTFELSEDGAVQNNTASGYGGGIYLLLNNAVLNIKGGTVSDNTADKNGGGIYANKGDVSITAGEIKSNKAAQGGGIYFAGDNNDSSALTAKISGGSITNNEATSTNQYQGGGGIAVSSGTVTMTGGSISGNKSGKAGGGIFLATNAKFSISGGSVTNNTVGTNGIGAGICPWCPTFNISGNPVISGNTKPANSATTANNIYLPNDKTITLDGELTSGASIGVTMAATTTGTTVAQGAANTDGYNVSEADALYFFYDGGSKLIQKSTTEGSNAIVLADVGSDSYYTVTLTLPEDGSVTADRATTALVKSGDSYSVTLTAKDGYKISDVKIGDNSLLTSTNVPSVTLAGNNAVTVNADTIIEVTSTAKGIVVTPADNTSVVNGKYGTELNHKLTVSTAYTNEADSEIALTYELKNSEGNELPKGLTLSKDGVISGTPTQVTASDGQKVTVTGKADNGSTAEIELTITISKATPTVSLSGETVTYTGSPIKLDGAVVTLVNGETYRGEVTYTYYSDENCTEDKKLNSEPTDVGAYYVKASVAATNNYEAAESSAATLTIIRATFDVSATDYSGPYDGESHSITVTADGATVTYSTDGNNYVTSNPTFTDAGEYTVYYKVSKDNYEDVTGSATVKITQAEQTTSPAVPTCANRTTTSVTLTAVANSTETGAPAEYSKDSGATWQDSNVFTGLTAGTKYTFAVRYKETTNYKASTPSTADIYTSSSGGSGGGSSSGGSSTYPVTVDSTKNGTVSVSPKNARKDAIVTITVKANSGYELDDLTVTDKNGKNIKVTEGKNGKFTFTMPASKVTVEASFTKIVEQPKVSFVDVPANAYYADAVAWAVENGITSGTSADTFSPDASCTRAQAVTFLWRAAGSPAPKSSVNPFADVSASAYYYEAVLWAVEQGITSGTSAATFSPDATCSRGQIVTFLYRADGTAAAGSNPFADVADSAYYAAPVKWAVEQGITSGTSATTFSPDASCTRAQIVTFLYRVCV